MNATTKYQYQGATVVASMALKHGTISHQSHRLGMEQSEPLIIMMDSLLRYARAYEKRFGDKLSEDYVLGPQWLQAIAGVRSLLGGDGAIAMELGRTTDSKDNGCVETVFWKAMEAAGFAEEALNTL